MGDYRRLKVWQAAHALATEVYLASRAWPPRDGYTLGNQVRRAAISIGANIAEGCGRNGDIELSRYVRIALGSANELRYLLLFAGDVQVLARPDADRLQARTTDICRMLAALHQATSPPLPPPASSGMTRKKRPAEPGAFRASGER